MMYSTPFSQTHKKTAITNLICMEQNKHMAFYISFRSTQKLIAFSHTTIPIFYITEKIMSSALLN